MRRRGRTDRNHQAIVTGLRKCGITVTSTANIGNGFPDLVAGWNGRNFLLEIKDGNLPPSKRKLTDDEVRWHDSWRGSVLVVYSLEDAINKIQSK